MKGDTQQFPGGYAYFASRWEDWASERANQNIGDPGRRIEKLRTGAQMPLERDIVEKIAVMFSSEDAPLAIEMLSIAGQSGRVARCIVLASRGNLQQLGECIQSAERDYRDAIVAGEYDRMNRQLRDLRVSFLIDEPAKMWIGQVASALAGRDYNLVSIQTDGVNDKAVKYMSDMGEGTATFEGDRGPLTVVKQNGRWFIIGNSMELERYNLNGGFDSERDFIDAISGYILARRTPI